MSCKCKREKIVEQLDVQFDALLRKRVKFLNRISAKQNQIKNLEKDIKNLFDVETELNLKMKSIIQIRSETMHKNENQSQQQQQR